MFEWDPRKATSNAEKHGVSFDEAVTLFLDADALDGPDVQHSGRESRCRRLGSSIEGHVLMVVYTFKEEWPCRNDPPYQRASGEPPRARRTSRSIDFSDIPDSSPEQLKAMKRIGRPPIGVAARQLIAIRLDPRVLAAFRKEAKRRGVGYQTLINEVLARHAKQDVA